MLIKQLNVQPDLTQQKFITSIANVQKSHATSKQQKQHYQKYNNRQLNGKNVLPYRNTCMDDPLENDKYSCPQHKICNPKLRKSLGQRDI